MFRDDAHLDDHRNNETPITGFPKALWRPEPATPSLPWTVSTAAAAHARARSATKPPQAPHFRLSTRAQPRADGVTPLDAHWTHRTLWERSPRRAQGRAFTAEV